MLTFAGRPEEAIGVDREGNAPQSLGIRPIYLIAARALAYRYGEGGMKKRSPPEQSVPHSATPIPLPAHLHSGRQSIAS